MKHDVISVVEGAYELALDTRDWLSQLIERCAPLLDRGFGQMAIVWRLGEGPDYATLVTHGMENRLRDALIDAGRSSAQRLSSIVKELAATVYRLDRGPESTFVLDEMRCNRFWSTCSS
jgi:hypothetical protein